MLRIFDVSLYVGLLAVLLAFAGRTPIGHLVLLIATGVCAAVWIIHRATQPTLPWKWTGFELLLICVIGLGTFQLTPLSREILKSTSPAIDRFLLADLYPEMINAEPRFSWDMISLAPSETRLTLIPIICVILLFLLIVQRFQSRKSARMAILVVSLGIALYAIFGIVQYLAGNGKFFGLITNPFTTTYSGAKGSFTNSNHFAGLLALALGPILAWTVSKNDQSKNKRSHTLERSLEIRHIIGGLASISLLIGIILSESRGGLALACVSIVITMFLMLARRVADPRIPIVISVLGIIGLGAISLLGDRILEQNAQELISADIEKLDNGNARAIIWKSNLAAQKDFRWFGTGLGTHRHVIPAYHEVNVMRRIYTHAENSYLQIGTECGIVGWGLLILAVLIIFYKLIRLAFSSQLSKNELPLIIGASSSFGVFLTHGVYDFAWYAPAYMLVLAVILAYVFSISINEHKSNQLTTRKTFSSLILAIGLMTFMKFGYDFVGPAAIAEPATTRYLCLTAQSKHLENIDDEMTLLKVRVSELRKALHVYPDDIDNQIRMATCLRRAFELQDVHHRYPMPIAQVRAAVYSGGFQNQDQLKNWLGNKAVLQEAMPLIKSCLQHAIRASILCPVRSEPLLIQADYCFTNSPDINQTDYYFARSERAEPYNLDIAFSRGYKAWNDGNVEQAFSEWKTIFINKDINQQRVISMLAPVLAPADFFTTFEPDLETLGKIVIAYQELNEEQYHQAVILLANQTLEAIPELSDSERNRPARIAFSRLCSANLKPDTILFISQSMQYFESSVAFRREFAQWLVKQREFALAEPHLEYCVTRNPGDLQVKEWLQNSRKAMDQIARESSMRLYR